MVKKLKTSPEPKADDGKGDTGQLAAAIKDSAQQIWLAGLGAFAKAQEEGGKVFEALVKEGTTIQSRTRSFTESKLGEVTGRVSKVAGGIGKQATDSWDKLEQVFEDRVARALGRLGVPTKKDVDALTARVEELNATVKSLSKRPAVKPRAAAAAKPTAAPAKRARKAKAAE